MDSKEYTLAVYVPGEHCVVDVMHPETRRTFHFGETIDEVRRRYPGAEVRSLEEWCANRAREQDKPVTWREVPESRYDEMMEVLPPVNLGRGGFQVGEPTDHHVGNGQPRFASFVRRGGKCWESSRPMTGAEFRAHVRGG